MELMEAIMKRRSTRKFAATPVSKDDVMKLLNAAVHAPNGMNVQNWAFGVITDAGKLRAYSDRVKSELLKHIDEWDWLTGYKDILSDPDYNVFYKAPALLVIYEKPFGPVAQINCCLAAENLMLAACDMGLGTCWIGFATELFNLADLKQELGVPAEYSAVAPIIVGYSAETMPDVPRNAPEVMFWL